MTVGRHVPAAALAFVAILAACTVDPAASSRSAAPTLNPNQLEALRRSAGVSPTPPPLVVDTPDGSPTASGVMPGPTPYDAALEAMLPDSIRGLPLMRYSAPASMYETGGDICSILCPGEPTRLSEVSGVAVDDMDVAFAYPDPTNGPRVGILAIRLPGVPTSDLVGIRIREGGLVGSASDLPADERRFEVGGRTVTRVLYPPFYQEEQGEYLLATDDVLFVLFGDPPSASGAIPQDVRLAIEALP